MNQILRCDWLPEPWTLEDTSLFYYPCPSGQDGALLYGCVSQGLGTTEFTNLIG